VRSQTPSPVRRLLGRRPGAPAGAGRRSGDPVTTAADLAAAGFAVALEHRPATDAEDPAAELRDLVARVAGAGFADRCELTVPVDRLGAADAATVARAAADAGLGVALAGEHGAVDALAAGLPSPVVVVRADRPGGEQRCRDLAGGRVRLTAGRGAAADLAFVRCLNVLMAGSGRPAVATTDPRLVAIAGERAAWNERTPDSWEYVMPWRVRTEQQRRLVAGGYGVRAAVPSGEAAAVATLRRLAGLR
jgi:proline dehydrogenase